MVCLAASSGTSRGMVCSGEGFRTGSCLAFCEMLRWRIVCLLRYVLASLGGLSGYMFVSGKLTGFKTCFAGLLLFASFQLSELPMAPTGGDLPDTLVVSCVRLAEFGVCILLLHCRFLADSVYLNVKGLFFH